MNNTIHLIAADRLCGCVLCDSFAILEIHDIGFCLTFRIMKLVADHELARKEIVHTFLPEQIISKCKLKIAHFHRNESN